MGATTAIISLVLGARQLTTWVGDSLGRRREAAAQVEVARQQASRGAFTEAWASLDRAAALRPGEDVDAARLDIALAWLRDARPGPGRPFSVITDAVTPVLDRALVDARGSTRADILAHLGWATFLRTRDGASGDPEARYREALGVDAANVYANAMLGHWLMWTGRDAGEARARYDAALKDAGDRRPFVRRLQIASLSNRGQSSDAELLRVADEMRRNGEALDGPYADRVFHVFSFRYRAQGTRPDDEPIPSGDLEATYDWVVKASPAAARAGDIDAIRARIRAPSAP